MALLEESLASDTHRSRHGLPGYRILFAPHAFALKRQFWIKTSSSPTASHVQVFKFHLSLYSSMSFHKTLDNVVIKGLPQVTPRVFYLKLYYPPTCPLRPIKMNNACPLRITATAGTKLVRTVFKVTVIIVTKDRVLQINLLHPRSIAGSCCRILSKILHCSLKKVQENCLPVVTVHPLRPAKFHRLSTFQCYLLPNTSQDKLLTL